MEWIKAAFYARMGWALFEVVIVAGILAIATICIGIVALRRWWRQHSCPHTQIFETRACDAVCVKCRKNLGFIGNLKRVR